MLKSLIIKSGFAVLLLLPFSSEAAELTFNDKVWSVEVVQTNQTVAHDIRNDFDLLSLTKATLIHSSEKAGEPKLLCSILLRLRSWKKSP
jgi:hypothetical protein